MERLVMSIRPSHIMAGVLSSILQLWTVCMAPPALAANITEVLINNPNHPTHLTIIGTDLLFGPRPLVVTLGEFGALTIVGTPTDTMIVANLPVNITPGDYLLTVSRGTGQSQNDEYDLTIGAVGPQGPAGPAGPPG